MIRVQRQRQISPLSADIRKRLRSELDSFFSTPQSERRQTSFDFDSSRSWNLGAVRRALIRLFHHKCAWCETPTEESEGMVERYRPASNTVDEFRTYFPDHYWWLAYRWDNLFWSCSKCARAKGTIFPVDGTRSPVSGTARDLLAERPLLLNPCADDPAKHLLFDEDGRVFPRTLRGSVTIQLLALNREDLVERRTAQAHLLLSGLGAHSSDDYCEDSAPFAGMARSLIQAKSSAATRTALETARLAVGRFQEEWPRTNLQAGSHQNSPEDGIFLSAHRYVQSIRLTNVGPLESLHLDVARSDGSNAPWLAIIGENNVGKSSVLKAIAVALDPPGTSGVSVKPSSLSDDEGGITVRTSADDEITVSWGTGRKFAYSRRKGLPLVLAYGATRLPVKDKKRNRSATINLFDPYQGLQNPEKWLLSLEDAQFDYAARALKSVMHLPDSARFTRNETAKKVNLELHGRSTNIWHLSDGLQSTQTLACDIMSYLLRYWDAIEVAEAIVLIDEIENHLHPKWKMQLVTMFRKAFPRVQFIVTTHDPLCLKGLHDGEVVVLKRNQNGKVRAVTNLPPVSSLRVDQLLTSEHFGLSSTVEPELENLYKEYYEILKMERRSEENRRRQIEIARKLQSLRQFGYTRRERLMLDAIDRFLSRSPETEPNGAQLLAEFQKKLAKLVSGTP